MNFLAHEFLSFNNKELRVGNFLADFIRGNNLDKYPEGIKTGILLHRSIDVFTDQHPVVSRSKKRIYPFQRKYTAVVMDIYYDYFLAKNWSEFSNEKLEVFASSVYDDFWELRDYFPEKVVAFLPNMRENDWFTNYSSYWGINKALMSIARRAKHSNTIENSLADLKDLETELEKNFLLFFPQLVQLSDDFFEEKGLNKTM